MYGENVYLDLGEGIEVKVWVWCSPNTPLVEKKSQAREILLRRLQK